MATLGFIALVAAFALASWLGWWTVPVLGLVWGWLHPFLPSAERRAAEPSSRPAVQPSSRPAGAAALAALLAWAVWLGIDAMASASGLGRLGSRLAGAMGQPLPLLLATTLVFPALLAWCASAVGIRLAGFWSRSRTRSAGGDA